VLQASERITLIYNISQMAGQTLCRETQNDWTQLPHPCNGESAYEGFEITMAMLRSVV
jgi:hypothetical protein